MQGKLRMTRHAWDRWLERFDEFDLDQELAAAIPWGGQLGGDVSLLAPCGAVFIVSGSNVRTVLTRTQAMANMQQFVRGALVDELPVAAVRAVEYRVAEENSGELFSETVLQQIAIDHSTRRLSWKGKQSKAELRAAGFDPADPKQRQIYQQAYFGERRRVLGTIAKHMVK
jgi:hypothetical protein